MSTTELAVARQGRERHCRLGVMGGTFDPIHHGHLITASEVAMKFSLNEVVLVPTSVPRQKTHRNTAQAEDRYLMTATAAASNPRFSVSRVDIDQSGNTYIADTLKDPRTGRSDDVDLFSITGVDTVWQILIWRDTGQPSDLAHFIGVARPGVPMTEDNLAHLPSDKVTLLEVSAPAISSTGRRTRMQRAEPIWYLIPDGIVQYIVKRGFHLHPGTGVPIDST